MLHIKNKKFINNEKLYHLIFFTNIKFLGIFLFLIIFLLMLLSMIFIQSLVTVSLITVLNAQIIDKDRAKVMSKMNSSNNILEKLLPEGSVAPEINGSIYYKKQNQKIKSVKDFEKDLKK